VSHSSLESDSIACNLVDAYAVEPKDTGHLAIIYRALLAVGMESYLKTNRKAKIETGVLDR